jgi:hypothetical protein
LSALLPDPPELRALAGTPLPVRWPHLARVRACLSHEDASVRALAASALADATGVGAFQALVGALDDPEPPVREAAVAALRRSCRREPGRFVHAAFHPRADVRRMAVCGPPLPGTESYGLYLAADPEVGCIGPISVDAGCVPALLARVRDGTFGRAEARERLARVAWVAVDGLGLEDWCEVLELFWDLDCSDADRALLFGALTARQALDWVDAAACVASRRGGWLPVAVEAAVLRQPRWLAQRALPLELRREAARSLLLHAPPRLPRADVLALAKEIRAEGRDPERLAGALWLADQPASVLGEVLPTSELLDGFASDPEGFVPLLALRRVLNVRLRERLGPELIEPLAGLALRIGPERAGVYRRLGALALPVYEAMLARAAPPARAVTAAARALCLGVPSVDYPHLVELWLRSPHPERCGIGLGVFEHLRARHPEGTLAMVEGLTPALRERLQEVLRWQPPRGPAFDVRTLAPAEIVRLAMVHDLVPELGPAMAAPSRGLALALSARDTSSTQAALALIGCHDPAPVVYRELDRALGSHASSWLEPAAASLWRRANLAPLGHAWLSADPWHAEALCRALLRDPRGFSTALAELLGMPRLQERARDAVIRTLACWEDQDRARFEAAMRGGTRELLVPAPSESQGRVLPEQAARWLSENDLVESALLAGPEAVDEAALLPCLTSRAAQERLLQEGRDEQVARKLAQRLSTHAERSELVHRLSSVFAWGQRMGEALRGQRFAFHLLGDSALGYTRLDTTDIYVSPMAMLRGERGGRDLVEGLILHEIGHHVYHTGPDALAVWEEAERHRLGPLLNLVADEHLERRLRAKDRRFGDRFKRLAAHAFHHGARDLDGSWLLRALGGSAASVLVRARLEVSRRPGHVRVHSASLLRALGQGGQPFGLFVRALRMGLGARDGHPEVTDALRLFGQDFKELDMRGLLEVARELARRFGRCTALAECVGGHEHQTVSSRELIAVSRGVSDRDVQRELPPRSSPAAPGVTRLDVGAPAQLGKLVRQTMAPNKVVHAAVARQVQPAIGALRTQLELLGLARVPVGGRTSGRRLDRARLLSLVARGEPRVMVGSELLPEDDVFLGLIIDCSGSMAGARLARAIAFGALVAEAVRGMPSIQVRLFGFDDSRLFDAGCADRCAVASLVSGGGNDDAAALAMVAEVARQSTALTRILVMVSDGTPSHCSVETLRREVRRLTREGMICVQVAVSPLPEICFPEYVLIEKGTLGQAAMRFGALIGRLVART